MKSMKVNQYFDNELDVLNPEFWAREAILALMPNMVMANLIHRDFDTTMGRFGDIVNIVRPGAFEAKRKIPGATLVTSDAKADSVQVSLDQFLYVSFVIPDGSENRPVADLVTVFMTPAVQALAKKIDLAVLGQHIHFWDNNAGKLGALTSSTVAGTILDTREVMNGQNAPMDGRRLMLGTKAETTALKAELFTDASKVGDQGTALRNASLGTKYGFETYMAQGQSYVTATQAKLGGTVATMAINNGAGYAAGVTSVALNGSDAGTLAAGQWITIEGDMIPHQVVSNNGTSALVFTPALKYAVVDDAIITAIKAGAVNFGAGYNGLVTSPQRAPGFAGYVVTDGWTSGSAPQVGQMVTFGTATDKYTITEVVTVSATEYNVMLDRPLVADVANDAKVNLGPVGSYNLAFLKNAFTLAVRPLSVPRVGALASVVNYGGLSIRVTITYEGEAQGHRVTVDFLCGVGVLDTHLAAVMFA